MTLLSRIIEAIHRSRRLQAEMVVRRYSHLIAQGNEYERRRRRQTALVQASVPPAAVASDLRSAS